MICPRCEAPTLDEIDRDGVTLDRCERCRGIWLDRGELEKLVARGREAEGPRPTEGRYRDDDDDRHHGHGKRRSLWDIFD